MNRSAQFVLIRAAPVAVGLLCLHLPVGGSKGSGPIGATSAMAQGPLRQLPGAAEPGRDRPLPQAPTQPNFDFTIVSPQRSPVPRAVDELHFLLNDIQVRGAKVLSAEGFRPIYAGLIGHQVTLADILDVADRIEDTYRRAGYILTRAYLPPQRVSDGIFTIDIVEGYVAAISIEGGDQTTRDRINALLQPILASRPLKSALIERALLLANDLPGVSASGVLRPSPDVPGASDLVVSVVDTLLTGGLAFDNRGSIYTGLWTVGGDVEVNSPFGFGDQLALSLASSPGSLEHAVGQLRYRVPVGNEGAIASFIVTASHGEPGSSLLPLNVLTDSVAVGPRLSYPIIRTRTQSLLLDSGFTVQDARVTLLGQPFSHDEWRVVDVGLNYLRSDFLGGSWGAGVDLAQGLPIFGATPDGSPNLSIPGGHTDFTKLTGTFHHTRQLVGPFSLAIAAQAQYAFARLIDGEQITFGGTQIGRGYDAGAVTGDHGVGVSVELRYDTRFPDLKIETVQPYLFFNSAKVWEINSTGGADQEIASTGIGVRFGLPYNVTADIDLAETLRAVPGSENDRRGTRILVDASVRF